MGFSLVTKFQIFSFSVLHTLSVLLLPFLIFLLGGCFDPEKLQVPPPVACESVESALNTAFAGSEKKIAKDNWVQIQQTLAPLSQNLSVVGDSVQQVVDVTQLDSKPTYEMKILDTEITYKNGQSSTVTKENKEDGPMSYQLCPAASGVSYHGLTVTQAPMTAPTDNCAPFPNCQINTTQVKFDQLIVNPDGTQEVHGYLFLISPDVPYIGRMLKLCVTQAFDINGQKMPVAQCNTVQNFGFTLPQ